MAFCCHIQVSFACDHYDVLAPLAKKHYQELKEDCENYSRFFLKNISERTGRLPGSKGGLCTWGMIGNYVAFDSFVLDLIPFWEEMLTLDDEDSGLLLDFEHIIVLHESESESEYSGAGAYEIYLLNHKTKIPQTGELLTKTNKELVVYHHHIPFRWNQH